MKVANDLEFLFSDFVNLKNLSENLIHNRTKDDKNKQVKWLKVKVLGYEKINPGVDKNRYTVVLKTKSFGH